LKEFGIPAISGSHFYDNDHVRIPFAGSAEAVEKLVKGLQQAAQKYKITALASKRVRPTPART
jgi:hypothetical protein